MEGVSALINPVLQLENYSTPPRAGGEILYVEKGHRTSRSHWGTLTAVDESKKTWRTDMKSSLLPIVLTITVVSGPARYSSARLDVKTK